MAALLTIAVPTYNRLDELGRLVQWLETETHDCRQDLVILISDNASTDETRSGIELLMAQHPWVVLSVEPKNIGPDGNFLKLAQQVDTPFFWLLSDDDLPASGLIKVLLAYLRSHAPDLLYLPSFWTARPLSPLATQMGVTDFPVSDVSAQDLVQHAHVNISFISSWVVRRQLWAHDASHLLGSNLLQLSWILSCLKNGIRFAIVQRVAVFARSGNTGGYKLLSVFGKNFPEVLGTLLADRRDLVAPILNRLGWTYLPALIWLSRRHAARSFVKENPSEAFDFWRGKPCYLLLHLPLLRAPLPIAAVFFLAAKALDRAWRLFNKLRVSAPQ